MSPKFIQALKSLGAQHLTKQQHHAPIIEQPPPISSSITTIAINILQDLLSDIQYTLSDIKLSISQTFTLHDKSQSEILFLIAILLTILLFVVILPIYEAIIATDEEEVNEIRNKIEKEVPQSTPLKMYKPGLGIVEVTYDSPSLLRLSSSSSSDTSNSSGSDGSLNGSICTHHSLETIEESEEEYLQDDEEEQRGEESGEVPGLDTTAVDEEEEEEEEMVDDKYCEFLSFCSSDD